MNDIYGFSYLVVGKGRWSSVIVSILNSLGRSVCVSKSLRQKRDETQHALFEKAYSYFNNSNANIVWFCLPPGPHIQVLVEAALHARLHVIAEKPWLVDNHTTQKLKNIAESFGLKFCVNYEYCYLTEVERYRNQFKGNNEITFHGVFHIERSNPKIEAIYNLGSHLIAIKTYAFPLAKTGVIDCKYNSINSRRMSLCAHDREIAIIDFSDSTEPIIQKLILGFEGAVHQRKEALFSFMFSKKVFEEITKYRNRNKVSPNLWTENR